MYPQVYAVPSLLRNASDLVHPRRSYCRPRNKDPFSPPLNFLSAPTSTLPCEASVLTRPRSAVTWVCDGRHAGKCHGQRAVPLLPSGLSGVARGRSAPPPRCPLPRSPTPPLPRRIGRGCSCSGTSDSLFRVSLSFHGLLKAVRLAAQPWDPPHVGISPERRSSCLPFPSGRQGSQFPVPAPPVIEPFPSRSISGALLIRCPAPELSNIVTT